MHKIAANRCQTSGKYLPNNPPHSVGAASDLSAVARHLHASAMCALLLLDSAVTRG